MHNCHDKGKNKQRTHPRPDLEQKVTQLTSDASSAEPHYEFGDNWQKFINTHFSIERALTARECLLRLLNRSDLKGETFLDIGSGSGLHSLAAWMSGAESVTSFDYDPQSVDTTRLLHQFAGSPENWTVQQGDVLSNEFLATVEKHSIVYSWGVLHHTGKMWEAIRNAGQLVQENGTFCIALYTSDCYVNPSADYWVKIKKQYNQAGRWGRASLEWWYLFRFPIWTELRGRRNPWTWYRNYFQQRGMNVWTNIADWLGGWPMEYAGVIETRNFCRRELGMQLLWMNAGEANTEYIFTHWSNHNAIEKRLDQCDAQPLRPPFTHVAGLAYEAKLPELADAGDSQLHPRQSAWTLFAGDEPMTLPHSKLAEIQHPGAGRYSHWKDRVYFSTLDGSDPNSNGQNYRLIKRHVVSIPPPMHEITVPEKPHE